MSNKADFTAILAAIEQGLSMRGTKTYIIEQKRGTVSTKHKHTQFLLTDNEFRSTMIRGRALSMLRIAVTDEILGWKLERWINTDADMDFQLGMAWTLSVTYASANGCGCKPVVAE